MRVYSHEGHGTTFKIYLPVADPVSPKSKAAEEPGPASIHRRGWGAILLADDEETVRRVAQTALQRSGYEVVLAKDGKEAVDLFAKYRGKIRLIILDLTMPVISGEEAIIKLRRLDPQIPILLASGYNQVEIIRRFTKQKITGFVQKPFTIAQLHEAVAKALPND